MWQAQKDSASDMNIDGRYRKRQRLHCEEVHPDNGVLRVLKVSDCIVSETENVLPCVP